MDKIFSMIFLLILFVGCGQKSEGLQPGEDYVVTISTPHGEMIAILYDETPKHKENFVKLARDGFFDGILFHRVIQDFMIQGGDPDSKTAAPGAHLGTGGPGYTIPAEILPKYFHERGALSAARLGDDQNPQKESSGSQFYVVQGRTWTEEELNSMKLDQNKLMSCLRQMYQSQKYQPMFDSLEEIRALGDLEAYQNFIFGLAPRVEKITGINLTKTFTPEAIATYTKVGGTPFLDGDYTVFGKVIKGIEVVDKIAALPKDDSDRPVNDIKMKVSVEAMKKTKITELYGFKY